MGSRMPSLVCGGWEGTAEIKITIKRGKAERGSRGGAKSAKRARSNDAFGLVLLVIVIVILGFRGEGEITITITSTIKSRSPTGLTGFPRRPGVAP